MKFKSKAGLGLVTTVIVAANLLLIAGPASAGTGTCGYYSESRAVNSTSACYSKQVRSIIQVNGVQKIAPWASYGSTSWQSQSYPSVDWVNYGIRTP
jgi:hypothetical protein